MTRQLAPRFESRDDLVVWIERCRANDPEQRLKERQHLARHGYITANESRAMLDLPPFAQDFVNVNGERVSVDHMVDGRLNIEASFEDELTVRRNGRSLLSVDR